MAVVYPDKQDFETVYENYYDRIYKYAYTLLLNKEDAEDVTEDTFLLAYANYGRYDATRASVGTWLARIAHNRAISLVRSAAYVKRAEMPEYWDAADDENLEERVLSTELTTSLYAQLSPEEREFLNLRYVMELKDGEIAGLLGLNEKAVNKRYQRLLKRCREILDGK